MRSLLDTAAKRSCAFGANRQLSFSFVFVCFWNRAPSSASALSKGSVKPKHKRVIDKYIGLVPTAPVRDQPVGSNSDDGVNLRFRYKLTNLRRKVGEN